MLNPFPYATEGTRIFIASIKNRFRPKKYLGPADQICKQIVEDCWNGRYFQTSTTNFAQFWCRDFGWCTKSLLQMGHKDRVHHTLRFALNHFKEHNAVTTTITPGGKPFDFPAPAVDSLPWLIHSIRLSHFPYLSFQTFLNKEIQAFYERFIDHNTGLVKPDLHVSSMKDYAVRKSSCYDNCMVGLLAKDLQNMKLVNPLTKHNYPDLVQRHFWNGEYFYDDLTKQSYVAGDANLFPFALGLIENKDIMRKAVHKMIAEGLDHPFPLKYTASRQNVKFIWIEMLVRDYESTAIWMHMGPLFVRLMQEIDPEKAQQYKEKYKELIETHQGFLEVFDAAGKPFTSPVYHCDRAMLWAANYVEW